MANHYYVSYNSNQFLKRKTKPNYSVLIKEEFHDIVLQNVHKTIDNFKKSENEAKNRYLDIPCWDHSRVVIESKNGEPDYIHANWINGFEEKKKFIAMQGPMKNTVADFWKVVWQQHSHVIVMLTKSKEGGNEKCHQYWCPHENNLLVTEQYTIETLRITTRPNYIRTFLEMTDKTTQRTRKITHFQCIHWPEHSTPSDLAWFVDFIKMTNRVRKAYMKISSEDLEDSSSPIIVHCNSGIGRTGTFCAADICLNQLVKTSRISIPETVRTVREQRHSGIISLRHYMFIHRVLEYFLTAVQNNFHKSYDHNCPVCY
uniref:protein-tyrosine-phosphatase n=1 Tax=Microplitis mediator bracovirus TaxID=1836595 RepID=A0A1D5APD6_9VIRU|nr:hypothetical protein A6F54_1 [Microplitis mediator bracovirus]